MDGNTEAGIELLQPTTLDERQAAAAQCTGALDIDLPTVVDDLEDSVSRAYGGWPDRLYVVGPDGAIVYQGGYGPFGFDPDDVREVLLDRYGPPAPRP